MMKSFKQFLSESVNISGDFNGNLYINGSESQSQSVGESFLADLIWEGNLYRIEVNGRMISKEELTEQLQDEYPGAIVHTIYPSTQKNTNITKVSRYHPSKLEWI